MQILSSFISDSDDTLNILYSERSRREQNNPVKDNYIWKMKNGDLIPIHEMTTRHLNNTINLVERKCEEHEMSMEYQDWFWKE